MAGNTSYDSLLSTTLDKYRSKLEDNVFTHNPLVDHLKSKDRIRTEDGGAKLLIQLAYAGNDTVKTYRGYDTLDITPQDPFTAAEYEWEQLAASVAVSGREKDLNHGEAAKINLVKAKIQNTEMSIAEELDEMFYGDGTTTDRSWNGLGLLVGDETSSITDVGGIDCNVAGNEFWRSTVNAVGGARTDANWDTAFLTPSKGNDRADFAVTSQAGYSHYEQALAGDIRYTQVNQADSRFENVLFRNVPLFFDSYCTAGYTYFLNSKYIELVGNSRTWFRSTGFKEQADTDAFWSQILLTGNLVISNRARQGVCTGETY